MSLTPEPMVILGTFRSGTSAVATALGHLGVFFGEEKEFQPADEFNQGGYFEIRDFQSLNSKILAAYGMNFYQLDRLPEDWRDTPGVTTLIGEIRGLLNRKFGGKERWGWKEPATTVLMPLYKEALAAEGVTAPRYPICVRHPLSVAASQNARQSKWGYKEPGKGEIAPVEDRTVGLWVHYTLSGLRETRGGYRQVIWYEDFLQNPRADLERLTRDLKTWQPTEEQMKAAASSVKPEWSHSRFTVDDLREWPEVVGRTYDVSMRAYKDPDGFMAGKFDAEVDELWDEWGTVSKMARPIQLPAGQMIFTWMERGRQNEHAERYSPTGTWQTFRGAVPVPQAVDVVLDPYQTPCQIWIRKAVWHTGNSERRAILGPGPNGALDDLFGMKRLTIFGPHALMVQGAPGAGPIEFEMEFKVITGQAVLNDLVNMLRARLEQTRRATASPYGMGRRK